MAAGKQVVPWLEERLLRCLGCIKMVCHLLWISFVPDIHRFYRWLWPCWICSRRRRASFDTTKTRHQCRWRSSGCFFVRNPLQWILPCSKGCLYIWSDIFISLSVERVNDSRPCSPRANTYLHQTNTSSRSSWSPQRNVTYHRWWIHWEYPESVTERPWVLRGCLKMGTSPSIPILDEARQDRTVGDGSHFQ